MEEHKDKIGAGGAIVGAFHVEVDSARGRQTEPGGQTGAGGGRSLHSEVLLEENAAPNEHDMHLCFCSWPQCEVSLAHYFKSHCELDVCSLVGLCLDLDLMLFSSQLRQRTL